MKSKYIKEDMGCFFDCRACMQTRIRYTMQSPKGMTNCPLCGAQVAQENVPYNLTRIKDNKTGDTIQEPKRNVSLTLSQKKAYLMLKEALVNCHEVDLYLAVLEGDLVAVNGKEVQRVYYGKDYTPLYEQSDYGRKLDPEQMRILDAHEIGFIRSNIDLPLLIEYHG